jgi:hypothetical protein
MREAPNVCSSTVVAMNAEAVAACKIRQQSGRALERPEGYYRGDVFQTPRADQGLHCRDILWPVQRARWRVIDARWSYQKICMPGDLAMGYGK